MDHYLLKRIKRQDRLLRKLLFVNDPEDSIKYRLDIMKSLVVQIPRELSDLAKYWSTKLSLHKSVYKSSLLLPPLREPPNPQAVGPVPVVAAAPKIVHKSTASSVQPKKSVIFDKVYVYLFGPERSKARAKQQQAETTNLEGSQSPDSQTVESILKFVCDHHHCSSCNDFDAIKYETKQPSSLNGKRLSGATSSSTRALGNQTDPAKKMSKFAANSIVHTATSNVQTGQGNLFVQRSLKRTSQTLEQSIASGSSSTQNNIGHYPSKKMFTSATPYTALITSNQTDQDSSFVQRSLKRTSQTLMDHSIAPGSSSSASLHQPEKRSRTSNNEPLRSKLLALVSAIPPMNDSLDIECLKSILRTVRKLIDHLKGESMMEDGELQVELLQLFTDKLHERARFRFFKRNAFKRNAVHPSFYLFYFEDFIKHQLTSCRLELFKKATEFGNQLAQSTNILYRIYCSFCKQDTNHSFPNCPILKTINSSRICFNCLEDGHLIAACPKKQT